MLPLRRQHCTVTQLYMSRQISDRWHVLTVVAASSVPVTFASTYVFTLVTGLTCAPCVVELSPGPTHYWFTAAHMLRSLHCNHVPGVDGHLARLPGWLHIRDFVVVFPIHSSCASVQTAVNATPELVLYTVYLCVMHVETPFSACITYLPPCLVM